MSKPTRYPDRSNVKLTEDIKRTLEWMTNPSTSQKVPKYVQKGMDDLKKQVVRS